jgi:erythromycin esterase-like protein
MWWNKEMQDLVHSLRDSNAVVPKERRAGCYGLDLYSLGASLYAVIRYLDRVDPKMARLACRRYGCLERWTEDPSAYGLASMSPEFETCEKKVLSMLQQLLEKRLEYSAKEPDGEEFHSAEQNARLVVDAEKYYRSMYYRDEKSWNLRDTHMFETLQRLLAFKKDAKAVVWAHNSHLGDARYTSMGKRNGEIDLGQLCLQNFGQHVAIIGCGTHTGDCGCCA